MTPIKVIQSCLSLDEKKSKLQQYLTCQHDQWVRDEVIKKSQENGKCKKSSPKVKKPK